MKMSLSLDTSSHRRTPVLQSDPYPYSLSTPGEAADPLEGQGMSDSAPSTADKDLGEQTETDGSGEDPTSAVTSFDNDPQNGDLEPDASETVETSKLDGAGPVEEQVEEPRSGPASEYEVVEIPDDVEGSDTDADGEDELVDDVSSNEVHTDPSIIVEDISANENEVQDGPSIPADVVPSQEEEADRPDGELQENGDVVPVEPEVATVSAKSADIADVFTESTKESTQRRETTAMKPVENDIDVLPSPSTESESGSLKRKREETQDDTSSTRSNFGKMARSRLSRKGKEKAAEDDASSTSSASSAVRLLNSLVGTPSDESSSFIQNSSPTHPRGNVIRVVRSLPKVEVAPPPPPPPPPLPPVLMHAHSHKRAAAAARQNTQPRPLPQRTPSTARVRTASPAASEHTPAPTRKPAPAPAATGTPVTRAHCRYHKVSIPENGEDEDEEDAEPGPRVFFVVPGCSLTDTKLMKEEDIKDEGDATTGRW
ncbi:hypothetical protein C8F01DRAFT_256335 [Mycena amicta]|nr:hypothetical protein C8F01DRAFT_256335 [Mycena amicta]